MKEELLVEALELIRKMKRSLDEDEENESLDVDKYIKECKRLDDKIVPCLKECDDINVKISVLGTQLVILAMTQENPKLAMIQIISKLRQAMDI